MAKVRRSVFIGVTAVLCVAVLALSGVVIWKHNESEAYRTRLENTYEQAFYDLVVGVDDIDVRLKKIGFSSSKDYQRELLIEVWRLSDVAESNLSSLNYRDTVTEKTSKFLNQLGDYAKYLAEKTESAPLTDVEKEAIGSLYKNCSALQSELKSVMEGFDEGFTFIEGGSEEGSLWSQTFSELEDTSIEYPSLIYDGPFSDTMMNRAPLGERGPEISERQGLEIVKRILGGAYETSEVEYLGKQEGKITTLTYASSEVVVQLSKDGRLISMNADTPVSESEFSDEECIAVAKEFIENAGFNGVSAVWVSNYYDNLYVNFVHEEDGVVVYPDLIKVKISKSSGRVTGVEAMPYYYAHTERNVPAPILDESAVRSKVRGELNVESVRLAIIPKGSKEILTYEIFGTYNGEKYFVYIDAETGEERNVLVVIDGEQGLLL